MRFHWQQRERERRGGSQVKTSDSVKWKLGCFKLVSLSSRVKTRLYFFISFLLILLFYSLWREREKIGSGKLHRYLDIFRWNFWYGIDEYDFFLPTQSLHVHTMYEDFWAGESHPTTTQNYLPKPQNSQPLSQSTLFLSSPAFSNPLFSISSPCPNLHSQTEFRLPPNLCLHCHPKFALILIAAITPILIIRPHQPFTANYPSPHFWPYSHHPRTLAL